MKYRAEIDGLRALAVLPVILFHAGATWFSGGYAGVDVFFVISGYLITTIIYAEHDKGSFSLISFYERRARRILPALFLVMATCIPFAWAWLVPRDFADFAQSLLAVTTFSSNFLFWSEGGYFNAAAELKPLLHTWSLAVEEQYYILFPLFIMLIWRFGKTFVFWALILGGIGSLAVSQWGAYYEPNANFYLLPTRGWEILIGALAAAWVNRRGLPSFSPIIGQAVSMIGLALIGASIFFFNEHTPFPSVYALVPTIGAVLIILSARAGNWVGRILSLKPIVGVGLVSYSAYLWHQPLFAFAKYQSMGRPSAVLMTVLVAVTFILAYLTWRFVERPFRDRSQAYRISARTMWASVGSAAAVFIIAGVALDKEGWYDDRLTDDQRRDYAYLGYGVTPEFSDATRYGVCFLGSDFGSSDVFEAKTCLHPSQTERNILLIGDSHASHLWLALEQNLPNANVMQATASGCRPIFPLSGEKRCVQLFQSLIDDVLPSMKVDQIILSARWEPADAREIAESIKVFRNYADEIVVLGPTIVYERELPTLLIKNDGRGGNLKAAMEPVYISLDRVLANIFADSDVQYVSVIDAMCLGGICETRLPSGAPVVWDHSHYTVPAADLIVKRMIASGALR